MVPQQVITDTLYMNETSVGKVEEVRLGEILDAVLASLIRRIRYKGVKVEKRYNWSGSIRGSAGALRQVFTNLVVNALEAVPKNTGRLVLRVKPARHWTKPVAGVRVSIADNGSGIHPDHRERIFHPFFTTKTGKGSGLGLWVSHTIVHHHGGSIALRTSIQPERSGTVFCVFLPGDTPDAALTSRSDKPTAKRSFAR